MPEPLAWRTTVQKPGAVNDIRLPLLDRLEQLEIIPRVEFEIGILNQDDPATGLAESATHRGPFAAILRLKEDADVIHAEPVSGRWENHPAALASTLGQFA